MAVFDDAIEAGLASGVAANVITDSTKAWTVNAYQNKLVYFPADNIVAQITSNTATTLTHDNAFVAAVGDVFTIHDVLAADIDVNITNNIIRTVIKSTPGTLTLKTPVYIVGYNLVNDIVTVEACDNTTPAMMPCFGIVSEVAGITDVISGSIIMLGKLVSVDTSAWSVGDFLYPDNAGTLTNSAPVSGDVQVVGEVVVDAVTGIIEVSALNTPLNTTYAKLSGATFTGLVNLATGANIASAAIPDFSAATGNAVHITGTTTTTGVTMNTGQWQMCIADAAWPLTHHATNLNLQGGADYTCAAGDRLLFHYDGTTVRVIIWKQDGKAVKASDYIYIRDEKATTTDGGTFTSGAKRTRDLTTKVNDAGGHATLAANQVTLAPGTYQFYISVPAYECNSHVVSFKNITDTITYLGTTETTLAGNGVITHSHVSGRFTITASKVFEVQHECETTKATVGFGAAHSLGGNEVYAELELWKEA